MNKINILYISYDGMTDSLGQSQVMPYLEGLSKEGYKITILSAEKTQNYSEQKNLIQERLQKAGIVWHPVGYTKKPPILSTISDILKLKKTAVRLYKDSKFKIVHCRSYIAAFAGLHLKKKYGVKFIFDMRGFYADERVDGNIWNRENPVFNQVYKYFKKKEQLFLKEADYVISLTHAAKEIMCGWNISGIKEKTEVIPCCADTEHLNPQNINPDNKTGFAKELGINQSDFILVYLGSVGTWYLLNEMMLFFRQLLLQKGNSKFLFITADDKNVILNSAQKAGIDEKKIIIRKSSRNDLPDMLSLCHLAVFFIKPVFSKKASSPTKLAELLGMGLPVVANAGVGDIDEIFDNNKCGLLLSNFETSSINNLLNQLDYLINIPKNELQKTALNLFSLQKGVELYSKVYKTLSES